MCACIDGKTRVRSVVLLCCAVTKCEAMISALVDAWLDGEVAPNITCTTIDRDQSLLAGTARVLEDDERCSFKVRYIANVTQAVIGSIEDYSSIAVDRS